MNDDQAFIEGTRIPKYLYKYGAFREHTCSFIRENVLYLSSPLQFNDPFDSRLSYQTNYSTDQFREFVRRGIPNEYPDTTPEERKMLLEVIVSDYREGRRSLEKGYMQDLASRSADQLGVFCLSENASSILMLSHYGESHRGFIVKVNMEAVLNSIIELLGVRQGIMCNAVNYQEYYPTLEYFTTPANKRAETAIFSKSACWSYESEWRIVVWGYGRKTIKINGDFIETIFMGCEISEGNKENLLRWVEGRNVEIFQLHPSEERYEMVNERVIL